MHQFLKNVCSQFVGILYTRLPQSAKDEVNECISQIKTPHEFKRTVRSLEDRALCKANERKVHALYLLPTVFPPVLNGENADSDCDDLRKLVFAMRSLYETNKHIRFCDAVLYEFCKSMVEKYKEDGFDHINYHLPRHLGWQTELFGPVWTTSASMLKKNHYLLSAFTGTINHCSILITRYTRSKVFSKAVILEDCLTDFIEVLTNKEVSFENDFGLLETEKVRSFREQNPGSKVFCRDISKFYLTSCAFSRF